MGGVLNLFSTIQVTATVQMTGVFVAKLNRRLSTKEKDFK